MNNRQRRKAARAEVRALAPVASATPVVAGSPRSMAVSETAMLAARQKPAKAGPIPFSLAPYTPAKGVLPAGMKPKLAMDSQLNSSLDYAAAANINSAYAEGWAFPGFTVLANWAQISEFRKPAEAYAREMTRKWIKLQAAGDEDKSEKLKKIEAEFKRLNVQAKFREAIEQDGFFGRSQIFIDVGAESDMLDPAELKTDLAESSAKVGIGSIKRLTVIEPIWTYPNQYNANDPLDPTFYKPISWFVMGKEIHSSRLLTIVTRDVPDILKPAYAFAGLSLSQMMKPYVDNWLRTRQSVSDLIHSFTVWTLKTDMSSIMNAGAGAEFFKRLQIFNLGRDNHGVNAINKDTEEFDNTSVPLGSLDKLLAQSQEQMAAPAGMPLIYMFGLTPCGLNATSDGEIEVFQDTIAANQEIYTPHLSKLLNLVQLSLFGEIDPDIGFMWNPLRTQSESDLATARKAEAETDCLYIDAGVLDPKEARTRIAAQEDSPYMGLDLNAEITPPADPATDPEMLDRPESPEED